MTPYVVLNTASRSGILSAVISVGLYFSLLIFGRMRLNASSIILAVVLSAPLGFGAYIARDVVAGLSAGRTDEELISSEAREIMIEQGFYAIVNSPIMGFGHGMSSLYAGIHSKDDVSIDNYYLSALLDAGYVGVALIIAIFIEVLRIDISAVRICRKMSDAGLVAALASAAFSIIIGQYIISDWNNLTLVFLSVGVAMGVRIQNQDANLP
jgi:hypothetical protein